MADVLRGGARSAAFERGWFSYEPDAQLDVLVASDADRRNSLDLRCHTWSVGVPRNAFAKVCDGVFVSSPEFVFLQMASELSLVHLIELGYELCGRYSLSSSNARGFEDSPCRTTASRIASFLEKAPGSRGLRKARRAAKYILNGSASPMETTLSMLLTLPMSLGGFALPRPVLNEDRALKTGRGDETRIRRSDLFWEEAKLAVEYDSDSEHLGSRKFSEDAIRRNEFVLDGVTVVTVTRLQIRNLIEMRKLADHLARHLGVRRRVTLSDYAERQHGLYAELLSSGRSRV